MNRKRTAAAFGWGVVATVAMSLFMIAGMLTGVAPMPKPIPVAIVARVFGEMPQPSLIALGALSHLFYGAFWAAVLAAVVPRVRVAHGIVLGVALWLLMQVAWLPFLGWGLFGVRQTPMIAVATLLLHLVYGATAGWLIDRRVLAEPMQQSFAGRQ